MNSPSKLTMRQQINLVISLSLIIAGIEILNLLSGRVLNNFGLIPRELSGLLGIVTSPLLHNNLWHFFSNILPFALFSFLLLQHGTRRYLQVSLICIFGSGLLVWIFGRTAIHVGASGLIYGYFGYLLLAGILSGKIKLIAISLFVGISYGGLVFGVLPLRSYISWESHLFGLLVGLSCAYYFHKK